MNRARDYDVTRKRVNLGLKLLAKRLVETGCLEGVTLVEEGVMVAWSPRIPGFVALYESGNERLPSDACLPLAASILLHAADWIAVAEKKRDDVLELADRGIAAAIGALELKDEEGAKALHQEPAPPVAVPTVMPKAKG